MQNNLGEGGVTGITLLLYFLWDWDPAITNLIINIPIFFVGWKFLNRITFYYTIIGTVGISLFLFIFQIKPIELALHSDMPFEEFYAGLFIEIGLWITFRFGGATGGVYFIALL